MFMNKELVVYHLCLFGKYSGQPAPVIGEVRKSVIQTLTVTYVDVTPLSLPL